MTEKHSDCGINRRIPIVVRLLPRLKNPHCNIKLIEIEITRIIPLLHAICSLLSGLGNDGRRKRLKPKPQTFIPNNPRQRIFSRFFIGCLCCRYKSFNEFIQHQFQALIFCFFVIKNKEEALRWQPRQARAAEKNGNLLAAYVILPLSAYWHLSPERERARETNLNTTPSSSRPQRRDLCTSLHFNLNIEISATC